MPTRKSGRNIKAVPVAAPKSSGMGSNRATRAQTRQSTKDRHSDESEYVPPVKTLNPQMFSRFVPEATEEEEQLQKTIDNLKARKRALEEEEKTVQEFMRLAKKTDPQYLEIQALEAEEAALLEEITALDESNEGKKGLLNEYRRRNLLGAASVRIQEGKANKLAKRFSSSGKADLRCEGGKLRELTKETAANLHILKHLPLLIAQKHADQAAADIAPTLNGVEFLDSSCLRDLEERFQQLQVKVLGVV